MANFYAEIMRRLGGADQSTEPDDRLGSDADQMGAMNPFQFWMQFAEQWQKASAEALASWIKGSGRGHAGGELRR